jgi:hypothetical protein
MPCPDDRCSHPGQWLVTPSRSDLSGGYQRAISLSSTMKSRPCG